MAQRLSSGERWSLRRSRRRINIAPESGLRWNDAVSHRNERHSTCRICRCRTKESGGETTGIATVPVRVLVPVIVLAGTVVSDTEDGIAAIGQSVLREEIAIGSIEVDGLMRKTDEHKSQYA